MKRRLNIMLSMFQVNKEATIIIKIDDKISSVVGGIGKILQDERKNRDLRQQKVADDLGIARAHLSKIENAKREHTSISTLIRLSDYYDMKLSEVIEKAKLYSEYIQL